MWTARRPDALKNVSGPIVLSICRLIPKKRVDLIVRCFAEMLRGDPRSAAVLVIGGVGAQLEGLQDLAHELSISNRVVFPGFIPEEALRDWYAAADVFVSADNADYDLTVMEALPHGKKIVVSKQYEIPHFLSSLRRFFFFAEPNARGYGIAIARALAATVRGINDTDKKELQALTWESYFTGLLSFCRQ
jgi:glycosyltransferase involved in cell wall biosynthesis